jgi:hypothetical protein
VEGFAPVWAVTAGNADVSAESGLAILATGGCLPECSGVLHFLMTRAVTRIKNESSAAVPIRASRLIHSRVPLDWAWL